MHFRLCLLYLASTITVTTLLYLFLLRLEIRSFPSSHLFTSLLPHSFTPTTSHSIVHQPSLDAQRVTHLKTGKIHHSLLKTTSLTPSDSSFEIAAVADSTTAGFTPPALLLLLNQRLTIDQRICLNTTLHNHFNSTLYRYIPHNTYLVVAVKPTHTVQLNALKHSLNQVCDDVVHSILLYTNEHKIDPELQHTISTFDTVHNNHLSLFALLFRTPFYSSVESIAEAWQRDLKEQIEDEDVKVRPINQHTIQITLFFKHSLPSSALHRYLNHILTFLSNQPSVEWLEQRHEFECHNYHASSNIQSGRHGRDAQVLYAANLTGRGVILVQGDTGVAYSHCLLHDNHRAVPLNRLDFQHRKIVTYQAVRNKTYDQPNGHGSHTACSMAGSIDESTDDFNINQSLQQLSLYDGVAKHAKLAIFDFNDGKTMNKIKTPKDIYGLYFERAHHEAMASISSNSWGARNGTYIRECLETDRFVSDHSDFLPLFSAGNFGSKGYVSVVSPGTAKNALTVGSVRSSIIDFSADGRPLTCDSEHSADSSSLQHQLCWFSGKGPTIDGRYKPDVVAAGEFIVSARSSGDVHDVGCQSCASSLLPLFGTSMSCALTAGAAALVKQYYMEGFMNYGFKQEQYGFLPSAALLKATIIHSAQRDIFDAINEPTQPLADMTSSSDDSLHHSARQQQQQHQYALIESSRHRWSPSFKFGYGRIQLNRVLKLVTDKSQSALFMHFAHDDRDGLSTGQNYSMCFQWLSDMNAANIDSDDLNFHTTVNMSEILHIHSDTYTPTPYFRATLVWSDVEASLSAAIQLVSDLNLIVQMITPMSNNALNNTAIESNSSTLAFWGNHLYNALGQPRLDDRNNVEQVTIDAEDGLTMGSRLRVIVKAEHVPVEKPQTFALVVTGNVKPCQQT